MKDGLYFVCPKCGQFDDSGDSWIAEGEGEFSFKRKLHYARHSCGYKNPMYYPDEFIVEIEEGTIVDAEDYWREELNHLELLKKLAEEKGLKISPSLLVLLKPKRIREDKDYFYVEVSRYKLYREKYYQELVQKAKEKHGEVVTKVVGKVKGFVLVEFPQKVKIPKSLAKYDLGGSITVSSWVCDYYDVPYPLEVLEEEVKRAIKKAKSELKRLKKYNPSLIMSYLPNKYTNELNKDAVKFLCMMLLEKDKGD